MKKTGIKEMLVAFILALVYRLAHIFPNNDPIMGFTTGLSKEQTPWRMAVFASASMIVFDVLTQKVGIWTWGTALVYGLVAFGIASYYQTRKKTTMRTHVLASVAGILVFDVLTGPVMSAYFFDMPWTVAVAGQVPFTVMHLLSGVGLTIGINWCLNVWRVRNESSDHSHSHAQQPRAFGQVS